MLVIMEKLFFPLILEKNLEKEKKTMTTYYQFIVEMAIDYLHTFEKTFF